MKKLLLFTMALFALSTVHAELILHESFDRPVGNLKVGNTPAANNTDWYSYSGTSNYISVVEGSLSYEGYAEAAGKKVELRGNGADDLRQFAPITSGKVYVAAIINVDSLKQYSSAEANGDYFLAMGDAGNSSMYARLYARSVKEEGQNTYTKLQLGIAKYSEQSTSTTTVIPMVDVAMKQNILVVLEYEFVAGDKNDVARLYVNPTKETTTATLVCGLDVKTAQGSAIGANTKDDASKIASVNLRKGNKTPGRVYVDEIKVATAWENLFAGESGETPVEEPEITATPAILQFGGQVFVGSTYTTKFVVKGKNLNGDITLTSSNAELTLDKTTIAKIDAESENGAEVVATLKPTAETYAMETVTLTSQDAKDVVLNTSWYAVAIVSCSTLAEAKKAAANASGWDEIYIRYTGEAVVTYAVTEEIIGYTYNLKYIEDNTAAIRVSDVYWTGVKQGDKITGFVLQAKDPTQNDVPVVTAFGADATIISSGNDVTPQVVTLADLKNNADDYLYELVKVEGVTFADNENWKSGAQIKQGENTAVVNLISGNELINTPKPAKADIIGISKSTTGTVLCVRGKQDVVAAPTAIENIAADSEVEIYTVSGVRVAELQPGVNIIRQGNKTFKVVR